MKCVMFFIAMAAIISGVVASPLFQIPDTRLVSLPGQTNFTVNTLNYCVAEQTLSYAAMTSSFFSLNLNLFVSTCYNTYNWFLLNYLVVGTELGLINTALTVPFGLPLIVGGLCGKQSVIDALTTIINTLTQGNTYLAAVNSTAASAITPQITALTTLKTQIIAAMSCANTWQTLVWSCTDPLYTLISQFCYQAATIMMQITTGWCTTVSNNPPSCVGATTVTTPSTTTTTTVSLRDTLLDI